MITIAIINQKLSELSHKNNPNITVTPVTIDD